MRISDWSSDVCSSDLTYRNDGALAGVPDERNFFGIDKSCFGLTPIAAEVWDGWIFVNLQPEPEVGLAEFLGDFGESYCGIPYVNADKSVLYVSHLNANWKVIEIGRAHVCTPVTNAHLVCRLLLEKQNEYLIPSCKSNN